MNKRVCHANVYIWQFTGFFIVRDVLPGIKCINGGWGGGGGSKLWPTNIPLP
jgi:hypothetical protein